MKSNILKSTTKIAIAGFIALGTLGAVELTKEPTTAYAYFENFDTINASYSSSVKDSLRTEVYFEAYDNYGIKSHRFTIENTAGTVVKTGTLNSFNKNQSGSAILYNSVTNISTSSLSAGNYRIKVTTELDDGRTIMSPNNVSSFTGAFTIDSSRNLTNFRP